MPERTRLDAAAEWVELVVTDADWDAAAPHLLTSMLSQLVLIRSFEEFVLELAGEDRLAKVRRDPLARGTEVGQLVHANASGMRKKARPCG